MSYIENYMILWRRLIYAAYTKSWKIQTDFSKKVLVKYKTIPCVMVVFTFLLKFIKASVCVICLSLRLGPHSIVVYYIFNFQIILSGSHGIIENSPRNSLIGNLTSVDPNPRDSHTYTLISGGEGKFAIMGDQLKSTVVLDYETMNKRWVRQKVNYIFRNYRKFYIFCRIVYVLFTLSSRRFAHASLTGVFIFLDML
jgi:hypothetical protein